MKVKNEMQTERKKQYSIHTIIFIFLTLTYTVSLLVPFPKSCLS